MEIGLISHINTFCTWFTKIVYLNLLWIFFTLIGFGIFGFFPSTIATLTVAKSLLSKREDISVTSLFYQTYKKEFWKSQLIGLLILTIGGVLLLDYKFVFNSEINIPAYIQTIFLCMGVIYVIGILYLLPLFVHFNMNVKEYVKNSIVLTFTHPFHSLVLIISCLTIIYLSFRYAGILLLFSGSVFSLIVTAITQDVIKKVREQSVA